MKEDKKLSGNLQGVNLVGLLQMIKHEGITAKVNIKGDGKEGYIHLNKGEIWDARVSDYNPRLSIYELLKLREGNYNFEFDVLPSQRRINENFDFLIMDGTRIIDQHNDFRKKNIPPKNVYVRKFNTKLLGIFTGITFGALIAGFYLTNPYGIVSNLEARGHYYYGKRIAKSEDYNKAIEEFNKAIVLKGNYEDARVALGDAYTKRGLLYEKNNNAQKALEDYQNGVVYGSSLAKDLQSNLVNKIKKEKVKKVKPIKKIKAKVKRK